MVEHKYVLGCDLKSHADEGWNVVSFVPGDQLSPGTFLMERRDAGILPWALGAILIGAIVVGIALATMSVPLPTP